MLRYLRLYRHFLRFTLMKEMSFRGNFLIRIATELLWFVLLCVFYDVIYSKTNQIAGWSKFQYMILLGTHFIITGIVETLFMINFSDLAEKVRTGKLDFALCKPVDEQFLLTLQDIDWATASNVVYGLGMIGYSLQQGYALGQISQLPSLQGCLVFAGTLLCGVLIFYSIMTMLAVTAVWLIRNQHLYEMWFYVSIFSRFPPEIFEGTLGRPLQLLLRFVVPVLIAVSVPAGTLARGLTDPWLGLYAVAATAVLLALSRRVFRGTLRYYRSASS